MAIPVNYIDKFTDVDTGERRDICPAADKVRVDNDNFKGTDLDEVLDEIADAIDDAGSGGYAPPAGGIPKDDLAPGVQASLDKADTAYQKPASGIPATDLADGVIPDVSGLATKTEVNTGLANKVDKMTGKGLSTNDYTTAEKTKLGALPTNAELQEALSGLGGGSVETITVGETTYTPDENGDVDLGDLRGQDGNSGVASADGLESVNNLNGGTTDTSSRVYVLGANQGKRLRDQIDYVYARLQAVYALLGNIAFWDGKPNSSNILPNLDWGNPKHTVTLALSLTNATVKDNGVDKANGDTIQVEEGGTLTLTIEPASSSYALTGAPTVSVGGNSVTPTDNQDGTYSVAITMGQSDVTLSIKADAMTLPILVLNKFCILATGPEYYIAGNGKANADNRAGLFVLRSDVSNPCTWIDNTQSVINNGDPQAMATYSSIPIPDGATKVSIECNSNYYYYPGLVSAAGVVQNADAAWTEGSTKKEWTLADYPSATHFVVSFKIGSAGSTAFTNETYESMGIDFKFT